MVTDVVADRLTGELAEFIKFTTLTFMVQDFADAGWADRMASTKLAAAYGHTPVTLARMFKSWNLGIAPRNMRFPTGPAKGYWLPDLWAGLEELVRRRTGGRIARKDFYDTAAAYEAMRSDPLWRVWLLTSPSFRDEGEYVPTTIEAYKPWRRKQGASRNQINAEVGAMERLAG